MSDSNNQKPPTSASDADYRPRADAEADIIISDDEQSAYLGIRPPINGGKDLTVDEMAKELEHRRVLFGVDREALRALAEHPVYGTMTLVAQGIQPVQGSDAELTFHFDTNREIKPRLREDGTVDYRDLGLIEAVTIGQTLVTLKPAVRGTPGKTVTGKVILPNAVRNMVLPQGKNTKISEDKLTLLAGVNGSLEYIGGKVAVLDTFTLSKDVSLATGNIDFDGSVVINGDVTPGSSVKAKGSITVVGNVDGAKLDAGADIRIVAGFTGQGRGTATCGGSFKALFVQNAEVQARGDVKADVIMHSEVRCGGSLIADGKKGAVIGGNYIVGKDVKAGTVGAPSGVSTTFELGIDPMASDRVKYANSRIKTLKPELIKLDQIIKMLTPLKENGTLPADKAELFEKAVATQGQYNEELETLNAEIKELTTAAQMSLTSQFVCKRELYYGTKVTIAQVPYVVAANMLRCRLYLNPMKEITLVSL